MTGHNNGTHDELLEKLDQRILAACRELKAAYSILDQTGSVADGDAIGLVEGCVRDALKAAETAARLRGGDRAREQLDTLRKHATDVTADDQDWRALAADIVATDATPLPVSRVAAVLAARHATRSPEAVAHILEISPAVVANIVDAEKELNAAGRGGSSSTPRRASRRSTAGDRRRKH
ncbi:hypothetical protein AB0C34_18120 [Nocardia sp. NPDC049220]|uniref:hypothetical protein n=1 Tax=Nocardia sp. NPDC049220 TaxID=3155273 RepID=UPI0033CFE317